MGLTLYIDHNVHGAILEGLRERGIDCLTCREDGTDRVDDDAVLARAKELHRVVFTQDQDFLRITHEWQAVGREFAGVVFAHQMGVTVGDAIRDLELIVTLMTEEEMRNRLEYLPL
jgi:hypothetical protein